MHDAPRIMRSLEMTRMQVRAYPSTSRTLTCKIQILECGTRGFTNLSSLNRFLTLKIYNAFVVVDTEPPYPTLFVAHVRDHGRVPEECCSAGICPFTKCLAM